MSDGLSWCSHTNVKIAYRQPKYLSTISSTIQYIGFWLEDQHSQPIYFTTIEGYLRPNTGSLSTTEAMVQSLGLVTSNTSSLTTDHLEGRCLTLRLTASASCICDLYSPKCWEITLPRSNTDTMTAKSQSLAEQVILFRGLELIRFYKFTSAHPDSENIIKGVLKANLDRSRNNRKRPRCKMTNTLWNADVKSSY